MDFIPKLRNIFMNSLTFYIIFTIFFVISFIYGFNKTVFLSLASVFLTIILLFGLHDILSYNCISFNKDKIVLIRGVRKKNIDKINCKNILKVTDNVFRRFSMLDYIIIYYLVHNKERRFKLNHSFFTNEEFRDIHTQFNKLLPTNKIRFVKSYYNII